MFPSPSLGVWRDFIYCSRQFINCQNRGNGGIWLEEPGGIKPQVSPVGAFQNTRNCREPLNNSKESFPRATTHRSFGHMQKIIHLTTLFQGLPWNQGQPFLWFQLVLDQDLQHSSPWICVSPGSPQTTPPHPGCSPAPTGSSVVSWLWWNTNFLLALLCTFGFRAAQPFTPRPERNLQEEIGCQEEKLSSAEGWLFHGRRGAGSCPLLLRASPSKCQLPAPSGLYLYSFKEMTARSCCFAGGNSAGHILG